MGFWKKLLGRATVASSTGKTPHNSSAHTSHSNASKTSTTTSGTASQEANPQPDSATTDAPVGKATEWFRTMEVRGRPRSPRDFVVVGDGGIPYSPIAEWFPKVSQDPWTTRMGIVPIKEMVTSLASLSLVLQKEHQVNDEDMQAVFDKYIGIVCIDCLAGISVDLLRTITTYSKARGVVLSDNNVVRLLDGKCHSCDFDHYGFIWFGEA